MSLVLLYDLVLICAFGAMCILMLYVIVCFFRKLVCHLCCYFCKISGFSNDFFVIECNCMVLYHIMLLFIVGCFTVSRDKYLIQL